MLDTMRSRVDFRQEQAMETQKPISPLCQRMIEDMRMRKLGEKTQYHYTNDVSPIEYEKRYFNRLTSV